MTTVVERVDEVQRDRSWMAVPVATLKKFSEDRAGNLAGLIAYYAFFSLFPLLLVLVTVLGWVLSGNENLRQDVLDSALGQFPVLGDQLRQGAGLTGSGLGFGLGLATALWAGMAVMKAAEQAMNDVWNVPIKARPNMAKKLLRALAMLVLLGGGLLVTTVATGIVGGLDGIPFLWVLGIVVSAALNIGIFLLGFRVLTARDVNMRQLVPGAVLAGVVWMALQMLGGYLVSNQVQNASQIYGTFAVVIGLLWWLHLVARVLLISAELNVVLADHLWPRSLSDTDRPTDRRALRRRARIEERTDDQDIRVTFD